MHGEISEISEISVETVSLWHLSIFLGCQFKQENQLDSGNIGSNLSDTFYNRLVLLRH